MDNVSFIRENAISDAEIVMLDGIEPMDAWRTFISIADKPDAIADYSDKKEFLKRWRYIRNQVGSQIFFLSIGGDNSKKWIKTNMDAVERVWEEGYALEKELECAILLQDKRTVFGITIEEGGIFFFKRTLASEG